MITQRWLVAADKNENIDSVQYATKISGMILSSKALNISFEKI